MFKRTLLSLSLGSTFFLAGCGGGGGGGAAAVEVAPLEDLQYAQATAQYSTRLPITPNVATLASGEAESFTVDPALPSGLELDTQTGEITGTPDEVIPPSDFIVTAQRGEETASATISIEVQTVAAALGGADTDSARSVASLSDGAFIVVGTFRGEARIGDETVQSDQGSVDIYLARFEADGSTTWVKTAGGAGTDTPRGIVSFDGDGFVVCGSFSEIALFGPTEPNQQFLISDGLADIFVARFDANGELVWAKRAGGTEVDHAFGIDTTESGESVVTGTFLGTATFGPGENEETALTADSVDGFLARFNADGDLVFARQIGGVGVQNPAAVAATPSGDAVVVGLFTVDLTIEDEERTATGSQDGFVARFSGNGNLEWLQTAGGDNFDITNMDAVGVFSDESVIVTGFLFGSMTLDGFTVDGTFDAFFASLDAQGSLEFIAQVEGTATLPKSLAVLEDDSFVTTGSLIGTATFGPGEVTETTIDEVGNQGDAYVARFDRVGGLVWAQGIHGEATETMGGVAGSTSSVVIVGTFQGEATFGAGTANATTLASDLGSQDGFAVRFDANGEL